MTEHEDLSRLPTGVSRRGGVYQLRVGAPSDLQHEYDSVDAWRGSLRTSDRATAARLAHAKIAEMHEEFERRRASTRPTTILANPRLIDAIVAHLRHTILSDDDLNRVAGHPLAHIPLELHDLGIEQLADDPFDRLDQVKQATQVFAGALAELAAVGDIRLAKGFVAKAAAEMGLPQVDWTDQPMLVMKVGRALAAIYRDVAARASGDLIETPPLPVVDASAVEFEVKQPANDGTTRRTEPHGDTLRDVVPHWVARTRAREDAQRRTEKALQLFEEAVGVLPLTGLNKRVGAAFLAFLLDAPARRFADTTASNHAAAINALVNVAVKVDLMERNPFDLTFEIKGAQKREAWTTEELALIYGADEFTAPQQARAMRGVEPEDAAMVLRVLLYTGARVGEIGQLATADVHVRDGVPTIHIHANNGTVKNPDDGVRRAPVARGLENLGFLEFVEMRRATGARWLFPSLHKKSVKPTDAFGKWFALFRKRQGLPLGGLNASHKYRHLMRSTLAAIGVGVETADALTGHAAQGSAGRTVYTHVPLPAIKQAVDRLKWPVTVAAWRRNDSTTQQHSVSR